MKVLVVYYSLSGHTESVAKAIAELHKADIQKIEDVFSRNNILGYLRCGFEVLLGLKGNIRHTISNPKDYDLVILGTPVWIMRLPSPMRTYITDHQGQFSNVAFFSTQGSSGGKGLFKIMAKLIGKTPLATLEITEAELTSNEDVAKIAAFVLATNQPVEPLAKAQS
ncbi:MAG: flavodoxin [Paraglaciecola sp.]|jgi:flavodoxin